MARDDYRRHRREVCERCGSVSPNTRRLDVHHKDRDKMNNNPSNLETLCRSYHLKEHAFDKNKILTEAHRESVRQSNKRRRGILKSEETHVRMEEAQRLRRLTEEIHMSVEGRRLIGESNRRRTGCFWWVTPENIRYLAVEPRNTNDRRGQKWK